MSTPDFWHPKLDAYGNLLSGAASIWLTRDGVSTRLAANGSGHCWAGFAPVWNTNANLTSFNGYGAYQGYTDYSGSDDFQWAGFDSTGNGRTDVFHNGNRAYSIDGACNLRFGGKRIAYLTPYHPDDSGNRHLIVNGQTHASGKLVTLALSHDGAVLVYSVATGTYTRVIYSEDGKPLNVRPNETPLVTFLRNGQPWLLTQTPDVGLLVYPAFDVMGYQIQGDMFNPDARMQGDRLRVVASSDAGVLREEWINFSAERKDLRLV